MRFDRLDFTKKFLLAATCCPARTTNDILKSVFVKDGRFIASDGEICINVNFSKDSTGEYLLPAGKVSEVFRELTGESVEIFTEADRVEIHGDGSVFRLASQDPSGYPHPIHQRGESSHSIGNSAALKRAINQTIWATDENSTRYALAGVMIEASSDAETLLLASTDSRRLSVSAVCFEPNKDIFEPCVIPVKALNLLAKSIPDGERVCIYPQENSIEFVSSGVSIRSQLVQGRFPKFRPLLEIEANTSLTVNPKELAQIVKQAAITTSEESRGVNLEFSADTLTVTSEAADIGKAKASMPIVLEGSSLAITLDPRYLVQCLLSCDDVVTIAMTDASSRVLFTCGDFQHVIMPLDKG